MSYISIHILCVLNMLVHALIVGLEIEDEIIGTRQKLLITDIVWVQIDLS